MNPRVLIIATIPYATNEVSRTLDSYFHFWDSESVAQIFTKNSIPGKGHCAQLFQITDAELLKCWLGKGNTTGTIYKYQELPDMDKIVSSGDSSEFQGAYRIGRTHTPMVELLRGLLWRKRFWCTPKLEKWLDEFRPDVILYNYCNHLFTQQIALYVAQRYDIPIITTIADDYYFNDTKSLSPSYRLFRYCFKRLSDKVLNWKGSAVYCSDKIRDKYNQRFPLEGKTVYFSTENVRREFRPINIEQPRIVYCGSIRLGRNFALCEIADALSAINDSYCIEVYTNEQDKEYYGILEQHQHVRFGGAIPYSEVQRISIASDILVVAEGFREEDLNFTRYSLSTKVADSLASGAIVLGYGPAESGAIEYLQGTDAAVVCTEKEKLSERLIELISDTERQKHYYDNAAKIVNKNHDVASTTASFYRVVDKALKRSE